MAEPLLYLGFIGLMRERIRGSGGAQRMDAQPVYFGADTGFKSVLPHNILIHRRGIERAVELARAACNG
jgi:hypothetical protein